MSRSVTDSRQVIIRQFLEQLASKSNFDGTADAKPASTTELDDLLISLDSETTPLLRMDASTPTANLVVSVGPAIITNPDSGRSRTIPHVGDSLPNNFTSGTITFPGTSGNPIVVSPGNNSTLTVSNNNYIKMLVYMDANGDLNVLSGTEHTAEASATVAAPLSETLPLGYITIFNSGGTIQPIDQSEIFQFGTGAGGGGGTGDANSIIETLKNRLNDSPFEAVTPNVFAQNDEDLLIAGTVTSGVLEFSGSGDEMISTQMLDVDFLASGEGINSTELMTFWDLDNIDTAADYYVSRNGGNEWQEVTMERVDTSEVYRGIHEFDEEVVNQSIDTEATTNTNTALTDNKIGQEFAITDTAEIRELTLNIAAIDGTPTGNVFAQIVADDSGLPSTDINDVITESQYINMSGVSTGDLVISMRTVLTPGTYHIILEGDTAYQTAAPTHAIRIGRNSAGSDAEEFIAEPTTWTTQTTPDQRWKDVAFGNGKFVAVASTGTGDRVMTSPDGITWTLGSSTADVQWSSVTYGNGIWVAVAEGTTSVMYSTNDGVTWNSATAASSDDWRDVTYGNGLFVAVASNNVMTSPDGITWTTRTPADSSNWMDVTYGNGVFVAVAWTGGTTRFMYSTDGITWSAGTDPAALQSWGGVAYGNGLFVAVAFSGSGNRVATSSDGITWTSRVSAVDNSWTDVIWGDGVFVAVASSGTGDRIMTSPDGITWTSQTNPADDDWRGVAFGNGKFVAVDSKVASSTNRVMTAPLGWADITGGFKRSLKGIELDLRVRIQVSTAASLDGYGIFYDKGTANLATGIKEREVFSFQAVADNDDTFTITKFTPEIDLLNVYYIEAGQVFKYPAFQVDGQNIIFPADSFNNGGVEATVTLVFDQTNGGSFDNSDVNALLMAENRLGSTDPNIDRSVTGEGILLRATNGALVEASIEWTGSSYQWVFSEV